MRYRILDRESTILMFDREGTINPSSSLQVMRVGDRGRLTRCWARGSTRCWPSRD